MISILLSLFFMLWEVSCVYADHLPPEVANADMSKMEKIFSDETNAISILKDPVSQNIFIKYAIFSVNENGARELIREELAVDVPGTKIRPSIRLKLDRVVGGSIRYEYEVTNGREARQPIWYFELVGLRNAINISSPPMWASRQSTEKWPHTRWVDLEHPPKTHAVEPAGALGGFKIDDGRLPGIVRSRFIGKPTLSEIALEGFHDEPPATLEKVLNQILRTDTFQYVYGRTIGPRFEPPTDAAIICDTFILDLIGQVREAAAVGWIKHDLRKDDDNRGKGKGDDKGMKKGQDDDGDDHADDDVEMDNKDKNLPGAAKSIIKKLTKVRRECLRGKFGNAREKLRALIAQVNAQRGKHLTDEAYYLIRFNAEFLLEKL